MNIYKFVEDNYLEPDTHNKYWFYDGFDFPTNYNKIKEQIYNLWSPE